MTKESTISNQSSTRVVPKGRKSSASFVFSAMLIVYFPIMFYLRNFAENTASDSAVAYALPILFLLIFEGYLFYCVFIRCTAVERACKILFLCFFGVTILTLCVVGSGFERIIGLHIILMSLIVYRTSPIKKKEWDTLYIFFVVAIVLVLLDNALDANINTNTSGFLLSLLFCVSFVRFMHKKKAGYLLSTLFSFVLQFVFASRTAMLGSIMFFMLALLLRRKYFSSKFAFGGLLVLAVLGISFAWYYADVLYPHIGRGKITVFGKDLFTGRENIWYYTFRSIEDHFCFGVGSNLNADLIESGFDEIYSNAHNQSVGLLASFGIFSFVLFYVAFAYFIAQLYRKKSCSSLPLVFIAVIFIMCFFETYFFVQMQWVAVVISFGLICGATAKVE